MNSELPDYTQTQKCGENGGKCNKNHVKMLNDGRRFICCTACGHIVEQLFESPDDCAHPAWRERIIRKEGPNKGKTCAFCTHCNKFKMVGEDDDASSNKKRRISPGGAHGPGFDAEGLKRLENLYDALQVQVLALQQQMARIEENSNTKE